MLLIEPPVQLFNYKRCEQKQKNEPNKIKNIEEDFQCAIEKIQIKIKIENKCNELWIVTIEIKCIVYIWNFDFIEILSYFFFIFRFGFYVYMFLFFFSVEIQYSICVCLENSYFDDAFLVFFSHNFHECICVCRFNCHRITFISFVLVVQSMKVLCNSFMTKWNAFKLNKR